MKTVAYSPNTWEDIFNTLSTDDASRLFVAKGRESLEEHRNSHAVNDYLPLDVTPFDAARITEAIEKINGIDDAEDYEEARELSRYLSSKGA